MRTARFPPTCLKMLKQEEKQWLRRSARQMTLSQRSSSKAKKYQLMSSKQLFVRLAASVRLFLSPAVHLLEIRVSRCFSTLSSTTCRLRLMSPASRVSTLRQRKKRRDLRLMTSRSRHLHSRLQQTRSSVSFASSEFIPVCLRPVLTFSIHQRIRRSVSDVLFRCTPTSVRRSQRFSQVISPQQSDLRTQQRATHSAMKIILSSLSQWSSRSLLSRLQSSLRAVLHRRRCLSLFRSWQKKTRPSVHTQTRRQVRQSSLEWVSFTLTSSLTVCSVNSRLRLT